MAEANWKRLKQSRLLFYGEEDDSFCTFLEAVSADGKLGFKSPCFHYWLEDAVGDYHERLGR